MIIWTGLNMKIGIVQKVYEWPSWYFAKMILQSGYDFGKMQLDHSYTFWTMPILIFSPVQIIMRHPLVEIKILKKIPSFLPKPAAQLFIVNNLIPNHLIRDIQFYN